MIIQETIVVERSSPHNRCRAGGYPLKQTAMDEVTKQKVMYSLIAFNITVVGYQLVFNSDPFVLPDLLRSSAFFSACFRWLNSNRATRFSDWLKTPQ